MRGSLIVGKVGKAAPIIISGKGARANSHPRLRDDAASAGRHFPYTWYACPKPNAKGCQ
jgi:hypothetical protein